MSRQPADPLTAESDGGGAGSAAEPADDLVCHCFGHRRADIHRELAESGATSIPDRIRAKVRAGLCACGEKNPKGRCCLGDVDRVVRELRRRIARTAAEGEMSSP